MSDTVSSKGHPLRVGDIIEATLRFRCDIRRFCIVDEISSFKPEGMPMLHFASGRFERNNGGYSAQSRALGKPWTSISRAPRHVSEGSPNESR